MKKVLKRVFWALYIILVIGLVVVGKKAVVYVNAVLEEYEAAQPENAVEKHLALLKEAGASNTLETYITFPEIEQAEYDNSVVDFKEYKTKLANAAELTYQIKTGSFSETGQLYQIMADDEPVAVMELESTNEEIRLAILKMMDWEVKSITPLLTLVNYEYTVTTPKGFPVFVNGHELKNPVAEEDGTVTYTLEKLYGEPEFTIYDTFGHPVHYNIADNHVTTVVNNYTLSLPNSYSVYVGDTKLAGTVNGDETTYSVTTAYESLKITDIYGNSMDYTGKENIYAFDYEFAVPDNYTVSLNGNDLSEYLVAQTDIREYQYCEEYTTMPKLNHYQINNSMAELKFDVCDNLGQKVEYVMQNGRFQIDKQATLPEIPAELAAEIDVMEIAKTWSYFMTRDLKGTNYGFNTIKKYLIKDSYLYNVAYKWATGIDITLTSAHDTEKNYFENEKISNFIRYSDTMFSCDISFMKYMYLHKKKIWVDDPTNSTFYFLKQGEGEKASWVIVDIQEIITE